MREILFRGKRIDNREWVYGLVSRIGKETSNIVQKEFEILVPVIAETVSQYTGLTDKNGRKIFEGDIINDIDYGIMICVFLNGSYVFQSIKNKMFFIELLRYVPIMKIIGNIFDNPELLEV